MGAIVAAVVIWLWDRAASFRFVATYGLAWLLLALAQVARGSSSVRVYIWSGLAEWAGLLLVTAIAGWLIRRPRVGEQPAVLAGGDRWFLTAQALLMAATALLAAWVSTDFSFDGVGADKALFGLAGRSCACPSALMLLGASILMAWLSSGGWRTAWQFAAMATGVLFTASIGWARIDAATEAPGREWRTVLMISTAMMTMMTWFGLARGLPKESDWITRGRQAAPVFAGVALSLLAVWMMERLLTL